jgi:hypothetical protein
MARKKGSKNLSIRQKKAIALDYAVNDDVSLVAQKHNLSYNTVKNIVDSNLNVYEKIKDRLPESMIVGAGIVGNLAIEGLKRKNLENGIEKASTLAVVAGEMRKIAVGDQQTQVNVNVSLPTSRDQLLSFLKSDKVVDVSSNSESASKTDNDVV